MSGYAAQSDDRRSLPKVLTGNPGKNMIPKENCLKAIKAFRSKQGVEATDENIIATIHLMNTHGVDFHAALDQSSRSGNDHGVDAWFYDEARNELFVYQSKLTESRPSTLRGLSDLDFARQWLEEIIIEGTVTSVPNDNHCLFNLYTTLAKYRDALRQVNFYLISLFDKNELEDTPEYNEYLTTFIKSRLNEFVRQKRSGKLTLNLTHYNLETALPEKIKTYPLTTLPDSRVELRRNAYLDLSYVPLHSLVQLYRQRGTVLFDKNVRLSLMATKQAKDRLVHPLEATLDKITSGEFHPSIFPFYHVGITIAASASISESEGHLNLEAPSIINGCQTITIANEYLKRLEKSPNNEVMLALFKQIRVIAKVVVGTTNDETKEITNANNRQNPIKNWQLFSNEPIHIEIEQMLKENGIFYERQEGKFASVMKNADNAKYYFNTRGTYIKVEDLGQIIAVSRGQLQWAAKPSDIFLNKDNHDKVFDRAVAKYHQDIIFCTNLQKAIKRGLNVYLEQPTYANSNAPKIFSKPMVRAHLSRLALLWFYQNPNKQTLRVEYSTQLLKIASASLVDEMQTFYLKVISKTKNWYNDESKALMVEVSKKSMDSFFGSLETELGIDSDEGPVPFTSRAIHWKEYDEQ
jgi:AIPR protein